MTTQPIGRLVSAYTLDRKETHLALTLPAGRGRIVCRVNAHSPGVRIEDEGPPSLASCEACWGALAPMVQAWYGWNGGAPPRRHRDGNEVRFVTHPLSQ